MDARKLSSLLRGRVVSHLEENAAHLAVHFTDKSALILEQTPRGVSVALHEFERHDDPRRTNQPTARQREYLDFIARYIARYGVAPAESDLEAHFLVSAPSVHQMIKTLERRGFITRSRDSHGQAKPRSIRIVADSF